MRVWILALPLLLAACVTPEVTSLTTEQLRSRRNAHMPSCADHLVECDVRTCKVIRSSYSFPEGAPVETWEDCRPSFVKWLDNQKEIVEELVRRDPVPQCFKPPRSALEAIGVDPDVQGAYLTMLERGYFLGSAECTVEHCHWVARNKYSSDTIEKYCAAWEATLKQG